MVKKLVTGLALSVGAGLALTVTSRAKQYKNSGWRPASSEGTLTPVTIRVHQATPRNDHARNEAGTSTELSLATRGELAISPLHAAELAEIKVMVETLESRSTELMSTVNQRIDDLQNHLPRFIDVKVTARVREVEERLRAEFQDESSRTLDAFLKTLDTKVLPRITLVEDAIGAQGEEIGRMRQHLEKTDETLERVLDRIERVVDNMAEGDMESTSHVMQITKKAVA